MRMRSPKTAPPEYGLLGSTAITPTVFPSFRSSFVSLSQRVLLPAPGGPVTPRISARPVRGNNSRSSGSASGWRFSIQLAARANARTSPATIFSAALVIDSALQQLPRDHQALDLAGAFADGAQLGVAIKLFDRIILDEAVSAVNLDSFIRHPHGDFGSIQLGHGGFLVDVRARILEPGRAQREQPRRFDVGGHIGQLVLNRLEFRDESPELFPLFGILKGRFKRPLGHADA